MTTEHEPVICPSCKLNLSKEFTKHPGLALRCVEIESRHEFTGFIYKCPVCANTWKVPKVVMR